MKRTATLILTSCLMIMAAQALAQSSLGIGANEVAMTPTGPFAHIILWMNEQQRSFYLAMTTALKAMREDPWQASILIGLSFIYGIFHAAGPGHGKAVISSYMIANETALRRGIFLSFISSLLQAIMAIVVVGLAWLVLRGTGISMNQTARYMEIASFALVLFFGLWLLARKLPLLFRKSKDAAPESSPAAALLRAHHNRPWQAARPGKAASRRRHALRLAAARSNSTTSPLLRQQSQQTMSLLVKAMSALPAAMPISPIHRRLATISTGRPPGRPFSRSAFVHVPAR